jgi:hypothetical protein
MNKRVQVILLAHAFVTAYCVTCGLLDTYGHFYSWLTPNMFLVYLLFASAIAFPIVAVVSAICSGYKHPLALGVTHIGMGAAQLFFGLWPLISSQVLS